MENGSICSCIQDHGRDCRSWRFVSVQSQNDVVRKWVNAPHHVGGPDSEYLGVGLESSLIISWISLLSCKADYSTHIWSSIQKRGKNSLVCNKTEVLFPLEAALRCRTPQTSTRTRGTIRPVLPILRFIECLLWSGLFSVTWTPFCTCQSMALCKRQ